MGLFYPLADKANPGAALKIPLYTNIDQQLSKLRQKDHPQEYKKKIIGMIFFFFKQYPVVDFKRVNFAFWWRPNLQGL